VFVSISRLFDRAVSYYSRDIFDQSTSKITLGNSQLPVRGQGMGCKLALFSGTSLDLATRTKDEGSRRSRENRRESSLLGRVERLVEALRTTALRLDRVRRGGERRLFLFTWRAHGRPPATHATHTRTNVAT